MISTIVSTVPRVERRIGHDPPTPVTTCWRSLRSPPAHWRKIWSTNPLERLNGEIKRRTRVVGIFPNDAAVLRLVSAVVAETHDEWQDSERRYLAEHTMALLDEQPALDTTEVTPARLAVLTNPLDLARRRSRAVGSCTTRGGTADANAGIRLPAARVRVKAV